MQLQDDRVPVTLLSGFLGAGKTTLLNRLVGDPDAGRIAVIMNEFGDVGLDHDLIEDVAGDVVLMHSGCLCCSIRGDLAKTMAHLLSRRKQGRLTFDRVVIETTGIADPGPILKTMVTNALIGDNFRTDGVVVLADAATGPSTLDTQFEAVNQLALADLIIVTKSDLVAPDACNRFETRLQAINATARRVRVEHGRVAPSVLFGLSAMSQSATSETIRAWLGAQIPEQDPAEARSDGASGTGRPVPALPDEDDTDAYRKHRITSASIELSEPIPSSIFHLWLETLMALKARDILRIKGIVHVEDGEWPFVFHGVQHIFEAPVPLKHWSGTDTTTRVVVIARNMAKEDLKVGLDILRMRPKDVNPSMIGVAADTTEMPL